MRHYGACTHDCRSSNRHPGQYRRSGADVNIVRYVHRIDAGRQAASAVADVRMGNDDHAHRDRYPRANPDPSRQIQEHFSTDVTIITDSQISETRIPIV
jgi:hypothetical protein